MDFSKVKSWTINGKEVKTLEVGGQIYWKKAEPQPPADYFYVENISGAENEIAILGYNDFEEKRPNCTFEYKINDGQWVAWGSTHDPLTSEYFTRYKTGLSVKIQPNDKLYIRGNNQVLSNGESNFLQSKGKINVGGDLTTLIDKKGNVLDLTGRDWCFADFFTAGKVVNADKLILPSTTLSLCCYGSLLSINEELISANFVLPSEVLAERAYISMFANCPKLLKSPIINATTIGLRSLQWMFYESTKFNEVQLPNITSWDELNSEDWLLNVAYFGNIIAPNLTTNDIPTNNASGVPIGWSLNGVKIPYEPFYYENTSGVNAELGINKIGNPTDVNLQYSTDKNVWKDWNNIYTTKQTIAPNSKLYLRGTNDHFGCRNCGETDYHVFVCNQQHNLGGDLTTILKPNGLTTLTEKNNDAFFKLFINDTDLIEVDKLILNIERCARSTFESTFDGCHNLRNTPRANSLSGSIRSYMRMFRGTGITSTRIITDGFYLSEWQETYADCRNLRTVFDRGVLGAIANYAPYSYYGTFRNCPMLIDAPTISMISMSEFCLFECFKGCTSLNYLELRVNDRKWNESYASEWVSGVSPTGKMVIFETIDGMKGGVNGIPNTWELKVLYDTPIVIE